MDILEKFALLFQFYPCYNRNLVGSKNVMGTDDVHFGNSKNFLSVEELENILKITSIEPRRILLKNLLVIWEEVLKNSVLPNSDEKVKQEPQVSIVVRNAENLDEI